MTLEQIIENLKKAQEIASEKFGMNNILQPGIIKELIIANILGHEVITDKDNADAKDKSGNIFEYLTSIHRPKGDPNAGCKFQIDRILSESSSRILRNEGFYFGIFKDVFVLILPMFVRPKYNWSVGVFSYSRTLSTALGFLLERSRAKRRGYHHRARCFQ